MSDNKLNIAFLWHMHQPEYRDPFTGAAAMPWVRLHACSGYNDMIATAYAFSKVGMVINLTPVLLDQLAAYAEGRMSDLYLELTKIPAGELTQPQIQFIIKNFFHCNYSTQIQPYRRYHQLWKKRQIWLEGWSTIGTAQNLFTRSDLRDLQVWFNLAWMGWSAQELVSVKELRRKGEFFSEEDKQALLAIQLELTCGVLDQLKVIQSETASEISFTPFYHPIAPLLCDTNAGLIADPGMVMPNCQFAHPADCDWHIREGKRLIAELTGLDPVGMWPAEGSVSVQAVELFGKNGVKWLATDEGNLYRSSPSTYKREDVFRPHRMEGFPDSPCIFFRERDLSDAIGFRYQKTAPAVAAEDLLRKLGGYSEQLHNPAEHLLLLALDGENPWSYFPDWGKGFMFELLDRLSDHSRLQVSTVSKYLATNPPVRSLDRLHSGSWINSDFHVWIGDPKKNRAWELLNNARNRIEENALAESSPITKEVMRHLHTAEGSDWFWWFGEPNNSPNDDEFDRLFRGHLQKIYLLMNDHVPSELYHPIGGVPVRGVGDQPSRLLQPILDGEITSYFEWAGAGMCDRSTELIQNLDLVRIETVRYGYDTEKLYICISFNVSARTVVAEFNAVNIVIKEPKSVIIRLPMDKPEEVSPIKYAIGNCIEVAIPLSYLNIIEDSLVSFFVRMTDYQREYSLPTCGEKIRFKYLSKLPS